MSILAKLLRHADDNQFESAGGTYAPTIVPKPVEGPPVCKIDHHGDLSASAGSMSEAIEHALFASGTFGIVITDPEGRVVTSRGHLFENVPPGSDIFDALPYVQGLEDVFDIISSGARDSVFIPNISVSRPGNEAGLVYNVTIAPLKDSSGISLLIQDVTDVASLQQKVTQQRNELHIAREEVEAKNASLEAILDTAPDAIVITDQNTELEYANPAAVAILGCDIAGDVPLNFAKSFPRASRIVDKLNRKVAEQPDIISIQGESLATKPTGEAMFVAYTVSRYSIRGSSRLLWMIRDVSDRASAERRVHAASEAAQEANEAKARFLRSVTHDLRQPLQALEFVAYRLARSKDPSQNGEMLRVMEACLRTQCVLLDDLADFGTIDADAVQWCLQEFSVGELFEELETEFVMQAEAKSLRLRVHAVDEYIESDPRLLRRILGNLLANAIRFTDSGGVLLGCRRRGNALLLEVWDSGIGMRGADLEVIFDAFSQLEEQPRQGRQGMGLGLAIAREFAKVLGHSISVASRLGMGSRFSVAVPIAGLGESGHPTSPLMPVSLRDLPVLVICEHPSLAQSVLQILERWGCAVTLSVSIESAKRCIRSGRIAPRAVVAATGEGNSTATPEAIGLASGTHIGDLRDFVSLPDWRRGDAEIQVSKARLRSFVAAAARV